MKLTCLEKQSLIRRRLEYWKHEDLPATGFIYNLYPYIWEEGDNAENTEGAMKYWKHTDIPQYKYRALTEAVFLIENLVRI